MSFSDRLRSWFKGETRRSAPSKSTSDPTGGSVKEIEEFIRSRSGVEAYLEPKTAIYPTTLLLVAGDGEYLRRPVRDRNQATTVCQKHGAPLYDAAKVGYPRRMRDFDRGVRRPTVNLEDLPPWPGAETAGGRGSEPVAEPAPAAPEVADATDGTDGPDRSDGTDETGGADRSDGAGGTEGPDRTEEPGGTEGPDRPEEDDQR